MGSTHILVTGSSVSMENTGSIETSGSWGHAGQPGQPDQETAGTVTARDLILKLGGEQLEEDKPVLASNLHTQTPEHAHLYTDVHKHMHTPNAHMCTHTETHRKRRWESLILWDFKNT